MSGISVALCCYNAKSRLEPTLRHLLSQTCSRELPWEVILVDNASTDGSADHARSLWPAEPPAPLRVVSEPRRGAAFARLRALAEAQHPLILFVDDDNHLAPDALQVALDTMGARPDVGACGGQGTAYLPQPAPEWFSRFSRSYAVGAQGAASGYVEGPYAHLYGAGLVVRTAAARQLLAADYLPLLSGRVGQDLIAGEDTELCFALRLAGWRLWYEEKLHFAHALNPDRLRWDYLKAMTKASGAASVRHDPYVFLMEKKRLSDFRCTWAYQMAGALKLFLLQTARAAWSDDAAMARTYAWGRLEYLARGRKINSDSRRHVGSFADRLASNGGPAERQAGSDSRPVRPTVACGGTR